MPQLTDRQYRNLLMFRVQLRRFLKWSTSRAQDVGLTEAHHQLLLVVRGHEDERGPTIREASEYLLLRHHSAVELVDRAVACGLVLRAPDADDGRVVRVQLTPDGRARIDQLSASHLQELRRLTPLLDHLSDEPRVR